MAARFDSASGLPTLDTVGAGPDSGTVRPNVLTVPGRRLIFRRASTQRSANLSRT